METGWVIFLVELILAFALGVFLVMRMKRAQTLAISNARDEAKTIQGEIRSYYEVNMESNEQIRLLRVERGISRIICFLEGKQCENREAFLSGTQDQKWIVR